MMSVLSAALFGLGLYGVISRRDVIGVLVSLEVMLGAATLQLVTLGSGAAAIEGSGLARAEAAALLVMVLAAAEAAVGLALLVAVWRRSRRTRVDQLTEVQG